MNIKICKYCGEPFIPKDPRSVFCCKECFYNSRRIIEGMSCWDSRLYRIWYGMVKRCTDPKYHDYNTYGAKGISVCDQWQKDFHIFEQWALQNGYTDELTIDRIDYKGNYEPNNCRWADALTQNNNRSCNVVIEYDGQCLTISQWSVKSGIPYDVIWTRYNQGWSPEKIFTTKYQSRKCFNKQKIEFNGLCMSRVAWDKYLGFPSGTITNRLRAGLTVEDAITKPIDKRFSHPKHKMS